MNFPDFVKHQVLAEVFGRSAATWSRPRDSWGGETEGDGGGHISLARSDTGPGLNQTAQQHFVMMYSDDLLLWE